MRKLLKGRSTISAARVAAMASCYLAAATLADAPPISRFLGGDSYATPDDAARAALAAALPLSERYEHGGAIVEWRGAYYITETVTSRSSQSVAYRIAAPRGAVLAGTYHTHPCAENSAWFSGPDIHSARTLGVPVYIADVCTGVMRVMSPAIARTIRDNKRVYTSHTGNRL